VKFGNFAQNRPTGIVSEDLCSNRGSYEDSHGLRQSWTLQIHRPTRPCS